MTENKVVLVGNGINNINSVVSWNILIKNLISHIGSRSQINIRKKPFPLLYEEIFLRGIRNRRMKEIELKKYISEKVLRLGLNRIHKEIMNQGYQHIITTNYDYSLEKAYGLSPRNLKNVGIIKESKYSLFRSILCNKKKVWHIHGECNYPQTITLGYEHYSGYLQHMRNYVVTGTGKSYKKKFEPLIKRLKVGSRIESWIDLFFTNNIYIIGFTFDFVEIHLWWLLTYRARGKYIKNISTNNKIFYFFPYSLEREITDKLELLKSNDVTPIPIKISSFDTEDYYFHALEEINNLK